MSILFALLFALAQEPLPGRDAASVMAALNDPQGRTIVVAHRGCHNPAPAHGRGSTPENSLAAVDQCVAIGADVMEADIRITRDGYLVMMHDATVDRTTDGVGRVSQLSLAELRTLRLRENEGGVDAPLTESRISTLEEMLAHAGDRLVLNLDVKDAIHPEVIAAVVEAGAAERVIIKAVAGAGSPPLASTSPYDRVPFMPMLSSADPATASDLPAVIVSQAGDARRPIGYEIPRMPATALPAMVEAARAARGRVWANSLWEGFITGYGGDADALKNADAVWGRMRRDGVSIIQTDQPEALIAFLSQSRVDQAPDVNPHRR